MQNSIVNHVVQFENNFFLVSHYGKKAAFVMINLILDSSSM